MLGRRELREIDPPWRKARKPLLLGIHLIARCERIEDGKWANGNANSVRSIIASSMIFVCGVLLHACEVCIESLSGILLVCT